MERSRPILEIAAHSLHSALQAEMGGADRLELCMALPTGGLTPSPGLLEVVLEKVATPCHVLIRPRLGDFVYTDIEIETMISSIKYCKKRGVGGIVIGCLQEDGLINRDQLMALTQAAELMDLTFHRAFDFVKDPFGTLDDLLTIGFDRILTSGQARSAWKGRDLITRLRKQAEHQIVVMPGAGINHQNIGQLRAYTGCSEFHSSAKRLIRKGGLAADPLEITTLSGQEFAHYETDSGEVALIKDGLNNFR